MPRENSPENAPPGRGNADYEWSAFDAEAYFNHYYGEPHPDDDRVVACAVEAIKQAEPPRRELDVSMSEPDRTSFLSSALCHGREA